MPLLDNAISVDLIVPFQILSFICAMLSLYVMQQTWNDKMSKDDPPILQHARRVGFMILTLGILWRISYLDKFNERPSAPEFMTVVALTLMFFVRAMLLHSHRNDRKRASQAQPHRPRPF